MLDSGWGRNPVKSNNTKDSTKDSVVFVTIGGILMIPFVLFAIFTAVDTSTPTTDVLSETQEAIIKTALKPVVPVKSLPLVCARADVGFITQTAESMINDPLSWVRSDIFEKSRNPKDWDDAHYMITLKGTDLAFRIYQSQDRNVYRYPYIGPTDIKYQNDVLWNNLNNTDCLATAYQMWMVNPINQPKFPNDPNKPKQPFELNTKIIQQWFD